MEHAAFESFDDEMLKDIGRLVINFGFAEFLLDMHVTMLFRIDGGEPKRTLISPLAVRRKIEILQAGLTRIPKPQTRAMVQEGCKLLLEALDARNDMIHGIWGYDGPEVTARPICISPKKATGHRKSSDLAAIADKIALASRALLDAVVVDGGGQPGGAPERLVLVLG